MRCSALPRQGHGLRYKNPDGRTTAVGLNFFDIIQDGRDLNSSRLPPPPRSLPCSRGSRRHARQRRWQVHFFWISKHRSREKSERRSHEGVPCRPIPWAATSSEPHACWGQGALKGLKGFSGMGRNFFNTECCLLPSSRLR